MALNQAWYLSTVEDHAICDVSLFDPVSIGDVRRIRIGELDAEQHLHRWVYAE